MAINQKDRLEILKDVAVAWLDLLNVVRPLRDDQLETPNTVGVWSGKQLVAHISAWEEVGMERLQEAEAGQEPAGIDDVEAFNQERAAQDADRDLDEILEELESTHEEFMGMLETSPALQRDLIAGVTYRHYREHIKDFEGIRKVTPRYPGT